MRIKRRHCFLHLSMYVYLLQEELGLLRVESDEDFTLLTNTDLRSRKMLAIYYCDE